MTEACSRPELGWASWREQPISVTPAKPSTLHPSPTQPTHTQLGDLRNPHHPGAIPPHPLWENIPSGPPTAQPCPPKGEALIFSLNRYPTCFPTENTLQGQHLFTLRVKALLPLPHFRPHLATPPPHPVPAACSSATVATSLSQPPASPRRPQGLCTHRALPPTCCSLTSLP